MTTSSHVRRRSRKRHSGDEPNEPYIIAFGIVAAIVFGLLAEMPWVSQPARIHLLQFDVVGLYLFLSLTNNSQGFGRKELLQGVSPWLLGVLAWSALLIIFPPSHSFGVSGLLQPFAIGEIMRLLFCFGIYYGCAYWIRARDVIAIVLEVLAIGAVIALIGMVQFSSVISLGAEMTSIFGNHEQVGSYLMLLFLVPLSLAISNRTEFKTRVASQVLALIIGSALMVSRTRSAWLGALTGIIVLAILSYASNSVKLTNATKYLVVGPMLIVVIAFFALTFSNQIQPLVQLRVATFKSLPDDASFSDRVHRWKSACYMTYEKPFTGWGLGSFPVIQQRFTGEGDPPDVVLKQGTGHSNLAHNYWAQWASETGCIGLFLFAGAFIAGLLSLFTYIPLLSGTSLSLLFGFIAALAAAGVDMIGAPSYTFSGSAVVPWLWMGLGVALSRRTSRPDKTGEEKPIVLTPAWVHIAAAATGLTAVVIVLLAGRP